MSYIVQDGAVIGHIHDPEPVIRKKFRSHCPTCKSRRTMVGWWYEWYGWDVTCLGCGEQWSGEEMCERPFERGWRQRNIERAKRRWKEPTDAPQA